MPLTPEELRQLELRRRAGGYDRESVDRVVEYMRQNYEEVWRERETLEEELTKYREVDSVLRRTLVSAQRAADEMLAEAEQDSEALIEKAQKTASDVLGEIESNRERLEAEVERLRSISAETRASFRGFLIAALELLETEEAGEEVEVWASRPHSPAEMSTGDGGAGDQPSETATDEADEAGEQSRAAGSANGGDFSKGGD